MTSYAELMQGSEYERRNLVTDPDWPNHLTPAERRQLDKIDKQLSELQQKRRQLMNRATVRKHRAKD